MKKVLKISRTDKAKGDSELFAAIRASFFTSISEDKDSAWFLKDIFEAIAQPGILGKEQTLNMFDSILAFARKDLIRAQKDIAVASRSRSTDETALESLKELERVAKVRIHRYADGRNIADLMPESNFSSNGPGSGKAATVAKKLSGK